MYRVIIFLLTVALAGSVVGETNFYKKLKSDYSILYQDLEGGEEELAEISNFSYKKDVATFKFESGRMHLLRFVDGRPTTALFVGKGSAQIEIPSSVERQSLLGITKDSTIDVEFSTCFIRLADNFDLKLKEKFQFEKGTLSWRDYNDATKGDSQGELFFKPMIEHRYDNYFQLLRSNYERGEDGYFWIDFNRYNFIYDPNRPQEVVVAYEFEGGDVVATEAVIMQKQSAAKYDNSEMSDISYPTTILNVGGTLGMGGLDGRSLSDGETKLKILINEDSLKFVSLFLHFNLKTDSIYLDDSPVDFHRRKDFGCLSVVLPQYKYQGDTIDLTLWYDGNNYDCPFPFVENPTPAPHSFNVNFPKGYNYIAPGRSATEKLNKKREQFTVNPSQSYRKYFLQGYASGYDTIGVTSEMGLLLNFLKSKHIKKSTDCFIPHKTYQQKVTAAFNFFAGRFGPPAGTFVEYIYPEGFLLSAPGLAKVPQIACVTEGSMQAVGGFDALAGYSMARQWYGSLTQPLTEREDWLAQAVPSYMAVMFLQGNLDGGEFYSNMLNKRDSIFREVDRGRDMPLALGKRATRDLKPETMHANKGAWLLHMLRFMMYDTATGSDKPFTKFLHELSVTANGKRFNNSDLIAIAEKYYGGKLDWFFEQWMYGIGYPSYKVDYEINERGGKFYVDLDITTSGVSATFEMPVITRVQLPGKSEYFRPITKAGNEKIELGPFDSKPEELFFNEFFSVLSSDKVKKK